MARCLFYVGWNSSKEAVEDSFIMATMYLRKYTLAILSICFVAGVASNSANGQDGEIPLGTVMPASDQPLVATDGSTATLSDMSGARSTVVVFWSNTCPWTDKLSARLFDIAENAADGVAFVLINSNDPDAFPKESLAANAAADYPLPYLSDATSAVAHAFGATRNPHFFVFDRERTLVYVGGFDDSPGDAGRASKRYVPDALRSVGAGQTPDVTRTKAFGCLIKPARR